MAADAGASTTAAGAVQFVALTTSDGQKFTVEADVLRASATIQNMLDDLDPATDGDAMPVPLPNVDAPTMAKVIEYLRYHHGRPSDSDDAKQAIADWDAEFMKLPQRTLFDLILAANYMHIRPLLDLGCQTVADMIKGRSPAEIRTLFGIQADFTPAEEEAIRSEVQWAFE